MKMNISVADVRKVCETLLKENGDVFETSRKTNVSTDDVRRIKDGRYMKSISSSYFDSSKWGISEPGVQEPEPVQLVMDDLEEKETKTETKPEPKKESKKSKVPVNRSIDETKAREICELICTGKGGTEIANIVGVTPTVVSDIRRKKTWKPVSSEYFELLDGTSSDVKVIKTGEIFINQRDRRRAKTKPVCNEPAKTIKLVTDDSRDILAEIEDLAVQYITSNKKIDELPDSIKQKVLDVIKEEVNHISLSQIKELTHE